jgi:hypothetical protein
MQVWCERRKPQVVGVPQNNILWGNWRMARLLHHAQTFEETPVVFMHTYLPAVPRLTQFLTRLKQTSFNTQSGDNRRKSDRLQTFSISFYITDFLVNATVLCLRNNKIITEGVTQPHSNDSIFKRTIFFILFIWFVRLLALRPILAYCASLGW